MTMNEHPISQAYQQFLQENYAIAAELFEQEIASDPDCVSNYWYLGLAFLLQGQEAEAQMVWMTPILDADLEQAQIWTNALISTLQTEVERQRSRAETLLNQTIAPEDNQHLKAAWGICQHIREIDANNLSNLWQLLQLSLELENFDEDNEIPAQILDIMRSSPPHFVLDNSSLNSLIAKVLKQLLDYIPVHPLTFQLASVCLSCNFIDTDILFTMLFAKMNDAFRQFLTLQLELEYGELCLQLQPERIEVIANLINWYQDAGKNVESVKLGQNMLAISSKLEDRIAANYLITRGLMRAGGYWDEAQNAYQEYMSLVRSLIELDIPVDISHILNISTTGAFSFYFSDRPQATHQFLRELAEFTQAKIQNHFTSFPPEGMEDRGLQLSPNPQVKSNIRIGYLSECLRRHSVGWISRWLFQHHDPEQFEVYAYSLQQTDDNVQQFIARNCTRFLHLPPTISVADIAQQIRQDRIDILIDLDSLTSNRAYGVLALRPAPIQVTWLGMDSSELPTVDYFIADPYVLPESADSYYAQKIWRLPQTYVAVDGFELAVPDLCREHLDIPSDAVIYLSSQTAVKRHPDTIRLQLQIIKSVPNSYFLIKGSEELDVIQQFFEQIASEEGVSSDRLRFLPKVATEEVHRANLSIADVVLDTYPYNGATTTLETLWMGIPIVTKVGEQFAARNSYTMMMNVGVTEGIAWNDKEYVEWGIRLGNDIALRQDIATRLQKSRQTAPLWNGEKFARDLESAYQQMWQRYRWNINGEKLKSYRIIMVVSGGLEEFIENIVITIEKCNINLQHLEIFTPRDVKPALEELLSSYSIGKFTAIEDITNQSNIQENSVYHNYGTSNFGRFTIYKWIAIKSVLNQGISHAIYTDVDVAWRQNPIKKLQEINDVYDLAIQTEGNFCFPPHFCTGFMSIANTEFSHELLNTLIEVHKDITQVNPAVDDQVDDQIVFNGFIHAHTHLLKNIFPLSEVLFANGLSAKLMSTLDEQLQQIQTGQPNPLIFHANWTVGLENKKKMLQRTGNWFLPNHQSTSLNK
jgi:predicted O-linked N-acetylglucosamine transferase (SPINDLY family)